MKNFKSIFDLSKITKLSASEFKLLIACYAFMISLVVSLYFNMNQSSGNHILTVTNKALVVHNLDLTTKLAESEKKYYNQLQENQKLKFKQHTIAKIEKYIKFFKVPLREEYLRQISTAFYTAGKEYNIDYKTLISVAWHENRFNYTNKSTAGALGVMQIMPLWLKDEDFKKATNIDTIDDLLIPERNITGGAYIYNKYRDRLMKKGYDWDVVETLTLLAYNRGITSVMSDIRNGRDPENGYATVVIKQTKKLKRHF